MPVKPTIDDFPEKINLQRIGKPMSNDYPEVDFARDIPFFEGQPIITVDGGEKSLATAEYMLGRYSTVILLDPYRQRARQISYRNGKIETVPWKLYEDYERAYEGYQNAKRSIDVDRDLYALHRHVVNDEKDLDRLKELPPPINTDYLPHHNDIPIIEPDGSALNHMAYAYRKSGPQAFYFVKGDDAYLVKGQAWPSVPATQNEMRKVKSAPTQYSAARLMYGDGIASLIHGHSVPLDLAYQQSRERGTSLKEYPRFGPAATRDEMIAALQKYGHLRYYDNHASFTGPFKVKLRNSEAMLGHKMVMDVQPLSRFERLQEKFFVKLRVLKLPV